MTTAHTPSHLWDERGGSDVMLANDSGGAELPPGTMKYPECECPEHLAGKGRPDSSVRLRLDAASKPAESAG
ncbi:hypothetical protein LRS74_23045 [Streptomyces sp. LX-29]|uniref:hypothetical protein n=1 Tax=Streptomyces sp. LX-29 TaxID=2900152 RepID=UPI00240D6216|nr:hypothetical protein [Streptomyces sp. LX-29]WFB09599.1 hypothetical protein LRS74_23045 [Streptomyces sp. LX-29]